MKTEYTYLPGYSQNATEFMAARTAQSHAAFLFPSLRPGVRVLDCGCGPGTITLGLARLVDPGEVVGLDQEISQIEIARKSSAAMGLNVRFEAGSIYRLPFPDCSFDVVFSHALFEHLHDPLAALAELHRVLRTGGLVALRSPDWGGFLVFPESSLVRAALEYYQALQVEAGGDTRVGRKFKRLLAQGGFSELRFSASYECYDSLDRIAEYVARRIDLSSTNKPLAERQRIEAYATEMRRWAHSEDGVFAQSWCEIIGKK